MEILKKIARKILSYEIENYKLLAEDFKEREDLIWINVPVAESRQIRPYMTLE